MTLNEVYKQARTLNPNERKMLVDLSDAAPPRKLSELRGLGWALWQDVDLH